MHSRLRNQHLFFWLAMLLILTLSLFIASPSNYENIISKKSVQYDSKYQSIGDGIYLGVPKVNEQSILFDIKVERPIASAMTNLYRRDVQDQLHWVGRIDGKGTYQFKLPKTEIKGLVIKDDLKNTVLINHSF